MNKLLLILVAVVRGCSQPRLSGAKMGGKNLCATEFVKTLYQPRGLFVTKEGDILAVERKFVPPRIVRYADSGKKSYTIAR